VRDSSDTDYRPEGASFVSLPERAELVHLICMSSAVEGYFRQLIVDY
jgi:hypothetical protein